MCGIAGIVSLKGKPLDLHSLKGMCDVIAHRGPDDAGFLLVQSGHARRKGTSYCQSLTESKFSTISPLLPLIDSEKSLSELSKDRWDVFLGHRRLAIIDLTPGGHQPMGDRAGMIWVTYNGEIYNYRELRRDLESLGHGFRSASDTEVIVHAYEEWGIDCVRRFNGMFAFAVWDNHRKVLYLARDRYGVKPLYYTRCDDLFLFASEIKAILAYGGSCRKEINLSALNEYFSFQNLFRDETLFRGIHMLPPGHIARADMETGVRMEAYWDYDFTEPDEGISFEQARESTLSLFTEAVRRQLVADVPVGSYLSGGMDSGSITGVASRHIPRLATFTGGFEISKVTSLEAFFDERADAELVSNAFKTEHYEQVIHAGDLSWAMPKLTWHLEDLRVGMSYPNYYVSRLASKFVKVCLTGAGGDELYGGYPWRYYRVVKSLDRETFFRNYYEFWQRIVRDEEKAELFVPDVLEAIRNENTYDIFRSVFTQNDRLRYEGPEDHVANSLYFEIRTFLHGLLIVGDKLSMANSLEERFPFLDNDLVDFAMRIPVRHKLRNLAQIQRIDENEVRRNLKYFHQHDDGKNVLREAMRGILPPEITTRRKQGFSAPDESWFRGENFEYVRDTLLSPGTRLDRYIRRPCVERILSEHASGINHRLAIWSLVSFEEWCRQFQM